MERKSSVCVCVCVACRPRLHLREHPVFPSQQRAASDVGVAYKLKKIRRELGFVGACIT